MYNIYNNRIHFNSLSWVNESNELIDFSNSLITESNFTINQPTTIYKSLNSIIIENNENPISNKNPENFIKLGEIIIKNSKYYFKPNIIEPQNLYNTTELTKLSWFVYKNRKPPFDKGKYSLKEGDVIKLGRETLLVREIRVKKNKIRGLKLNYNETMNKNNNNVNNNKGIFSFHTVTSESINLDDDFNDNENEEDVKVYDNSNSKKNKKENIIAFTSVNLDNKDKSFNKDLLLNTNKKKKICRICYLEEENKISNPLIKPCKCSGSMKYIHYECLLHWLRTKLIINKRSVIDNGFFDIYKLDLIECELCKNHLLNYINHNNKIYSLIDYYLLDKKLDKLLSKKEKSKSKEENNYIIFDEILPSKNEYLNRYIVKFNSDNTLKIGRGLENQLILNDISVSRNHSLIKLDQSYNVILEDNNSKFGTLVLIQAKEIEILKGKTLTIQSGTNYFKFKLELPKKSFFSCCNAEEIDEKNNYEKINSKWVKFDKSNEILNESVSDSESCEEKNDNDNKSKKSIIKENSSNTIKRKRKQEEELIDIDVKEEEKENLMNIINLDEIKKDNMNINNITTNVNNIDSAMNVSTLKVNTIQNANVSQLDNIIQAINEIREENKSENENEENYENIINESKKSDFNDDNVKNSQNSNSNKE